MILILLLVVAMPLSAEQSSWELGIGEWSRPRHGASLVGFPALSATVRYWQKDVSQIILVRYPGGEAGMLWARELRDWLVSLGIPSSRINLQPGTPRADRVLLEVVKERE